MLPEPPFSGFWELVFLMLAMIAWRLWGWRIVATLRAFDERRRAADLQLMYDRSNPTSHFRQSVDQINDDTPAVTQPSPGSFVWNGEHYESREDAEQARWLHVLREARDFYKDLDRSFGNRISGRRASDTINRDDGTSSGN